MTKIQFKKAGLDNSQLLEKKELYDKIMDGIENTHKTNNNKNLRLIYKGVAIVAFLLILCITNITVYAFSADYRNLLAEKLNIGNEEIHYVGKSVSDNGITMTIESYHVSNHSAVVLLAFTKNNGNVFGNSLNPNIGTIICNKLVVSFTGFYSELSDDSKTLYCFYTWNLTDNISDQFTTITIRDLICNQSQADGLNYTDNKIFGEWSLQFELSSNIDNSITVNNTDVSNTIIMCGKELQIDSVTLADMLLIVNTTTLGDSGMSKQVDPLSNINPRSGAYYDVFIHLEYENGTLSEYKDCIIDNNGDIISWFPENIKIDKVKKIHIGNVTISL